MSETPICSKCGAHLPDDAPAGLCPKCLVQAGLESEGQASLEPELTAPSPASSGFEPPSIEDLADRFPQLEILELLGTGGMGAVYKARQKDLDRLVAVKILPLEVGADQAFAERFIREARALAKLNHPHIVSVYDSGRAGQLYYFIMEYIDGVNLRQAMRAARLSPEKALAIVPQICEALQYAHDQGIVHRDIKPENILITQQGHVKIADFGLAKLLGQVPLERTLTGTHQVMGTLHYMAPEQMERSHSVDHRADIYSLGVVFYEMLTGQLPLGRFEPPSKKVQLDVRLDEVVLRSLESEPSRRYQCASELKMDVSSIAESKDRKLPEHPQSAGIRQRRSLDNSAEPQPRYSRKAIFGAAWASFLFLAAISFVVTATRETVKPVRTDAASEERGATTVTKEDLLFGQKTVTHIPAFDANNTDTVQVKRYGSGPAWWQWVLIFTVLPLGLMAPIGTTVLGIVSISEIRHSSGRLIGLPLALTDALLFPLLLLDVLVFIVLATLIGFLFVFGDRSLEYWGVTLMVPMGVTALLAVPICVLVDYLIVRAAWRKVRVAPTGLRGATL